MNNRGTDYFKAVKFAQKKQQQKTLFCIHKNSASPCAQAQNIMSACYSLEIFKCNFHAWTCKFSLQIVTLVGGGISVAFQGLLKLLKIVLRHCHLPLHQQNVLYERGGAGMTENKKHTVRNRMLDIEQSERDGIQGFSAQGKMIRITSI